MITTFANPDIECRNEYDVFLDVYFKGLPFTGTIRDGQETIRYKDGKIHGQYIILYPNNELKSDEYYENGEFLSSREFYQSGQLKCESLNSHIKKWNEEGVLIQMNGEHYFENGKLRILSGGDLDDFAFKYFTPDGEWIYTQRKDVWIDSQYKRVIDYDHELMYKWYYKLLNKIASDESESNRIHHIWMWFWEVYNQDRNKYFTILNNLLNHDDLDVLRKLANIIAVRKFHPYLNKENERNHKAYQLIKESTDYHNNRDENRSLKKGDI